MWPFFKQPVALRLQSPGISVPPLQTYYPSEDKMDKAQKGFFKRWRSELERGNAWDIGENISYIFCYCYDIQAKGDLELVYSQMHALADVYSANLKVRTYCLDWAIDSLIGMSRLKAALEEFPPLPLDRSGSIRTDVLLSLKFALQAQIAGRDVLTLNGPSVTQYAREHLGEISRVADILVGMQELHQGSVIADWIARFKVWNSDHHMFNGSVAGRKTSALKVYTFSRSSEVLEICRGITREAENTFREERGVPRVGEGWISETELFYQIKSAFPKWNVVHHGRPKWLGSQHLDVYIEEINVALEYQGAQHYSPVAYFGGEEALAKTRERDARKLRLCSKHGVTLIVVDEGYSVGEIINRICDAAKNSA